MRRWQRYILIVFIYIGLFLALFAVPQTTAAQRVIRVGWYEAPGLQEGTSADNLSGFNYEYLVRIAQYADWQYDFVFGDFGTLEKELIAGNIDIMGDVAKTEARLSLYDYCAYPSCYSHTLLLCRPEDMRFAYNDYGSFDGIVVGNSGSAFRKSMLDREAEEQHFRVTYRDYDTDGEMLTALTRGDVDTAVISDALQHKQYKILHEWEPAAQYFIVHKGSTDILMELNNAMSSIQSADRSIQAHLFEKYFGGDNSDFSVALTREEMAYVAGAPNLTVLLAENQKPLSYIEDGQAKGFIPDYLGLISAQTGLRFTYIWCRDHAEMVQRFEAGEGDICGQAHDNYGQSQGVRIKRVQPYVNLSYGLVYNPAVTQTVHTVAVEELDALMIDRLKKLGFTPVAFRTPRECLDAVNDQHVDAAAMANNIFEQLAYHAAYIDLVYKAQSGLDVGLCLGVSKQESPYLFRILSKATGVVPPNVIAQLMLNNNSLSPQYTIEDYIYLNRNFLYIIVILIIIILFLALWYRRQKRYNQYMHQAAEAKAAFFNNLSHDLRTPLTGILGYSELAVKEECADKKQQYLDKINMSGKVLLDLINDTLSLAKIERERFALSPTSFNVYSFLQATILSIQSQTQQKEQQFHCFFKIPQDEWIVADKLKFQDILLNILSNAVKYTPRGGSIEFSVEHGPQQTYKIIVKDTGIGMSPEFLEHLFEPFAQERDARSTTVVGTGLGMSIVKRIVDLMQGTIQVQSEKGVGTEITISLPVVLQEAPQAESISPVEQSLYDEENLQGMQVLLCEDNGLNREIIKELLKPKGILVDEAVNGEEGVKLFAMSAPGYYSVVLMDIRMPVLDGYGATARIRSMNRPDALTVPIIALSANAYEEDVRESLAHKMNEHLSKPIDSVRLWATLAKYAGKNKN